MTREQVINKVKARIDELEPFSDVELNPSIDVTSNIVDDSANSFALSIPSSLLSPESFAGSTHVRYTEEGIGKVDLPADYLKLHSFKMLTWERDVTNSITPADPKYKLQSNAITRGGVSKPTVVVKNGYLWYYSLPIGVEGVIEEALYIKKQDATTIPDNLIIPYVWYCAAEVLQIMGEERLSGMAREKVHESILSLTT